MHGIQEDGAQDCGLGSMGSVWPRCEKTCLRGFANNTGANQPAHLRSLISAIVNRVLKSTISKLATSEMSVF